MKKLFGRIFNGSWVCTKGCYHEPHHKKCECDCHDHLRSIILEYNYNKKKGYSK